MGSVITYVTHVPVALTALGEQPHLLYALKALTLAMDRPHVYYALQVCKSILSESMLIRV